MDRIQLWRSVEFVNKIPYRTKLLDEQYLDGPDTGRTWKWKYFSFENVSQNC